MARIKPAPDQFDLTVETVIVGAGAAGLVAALSAYEAGCDVLVLERDAKPAGSTALSAGLIPAAGTKFQAAAGIDDTPERFARDIQTKAKGENDPALVRLMTRHAADVIEWLHKVHGLAFSVVDDFDYPGHTRRRMHGLPTRSGSELIEALRARCETLGIDIVCNAHAEELFTDSDVIRGVGLIRPDGQKEQIGCRALILACNGFGGNRHLVAQHMPEIENALWFGHDGNTGDAILWAEKLDLKTRHLGAYQGHGNVAHPHGILITWAVITEGGFQVNSEGQRFWDESQGYSEAARAVLDQPGGLAWTIFDTRIAGIARQFADFRDAEAQGAILRADSLEELEHALSLPDGALARELAHLQPGEVDRFGRTGASQSLRAPFCAVRVTGALFHTQGGLVIDDSAHAVSTSGEAVQNLFAAGGAACGVSGSGDAGYLSGNGLLSAVVLGRIAGRNAACQGA